MPLIRRAAAITHARPTRLEAGMHVRIERGLDDDSLHLPEKPLAGCLACCRCKRSSDLLASFRAGRGEQLSDLDRLEAGVFVGSKRRVVGPLDGPGNHEG